jgi:uncharacterized protein (UPF0332 family)
MSLGGFQPRCAKTASGKSGLGNFRRSAVSRSYYAAYCVARNHLRTEGAYINKHWELWDAYRKHTDAARKQIGVDGDRLRARRNNADYDDVLTDTPKKAAVAVVMATSIVKAVDGL